MFKGLAAATLSLALVFQLPVSPTPAHAASCSVAGGQSGRLKYSGQLSPISATVCGNQIWKLIGKPKKPVKPIKPTKPRKYVNNFTVTPDRPGIETKTSFKVGETGNLTALAKRHLRNRLLFWYPSQVRFVPKTYLWNFGDGLVSSLNSPTHLWSTKGTFSVRLTVGYSVKYRIIGHSSWIALNGFVFAKSAPVNVTVGSQPMQVRDSVALVHWLCTQKPSAVGC